MWEAGGFPLEFPVISLGETNLRPTAMLFRNLASMDVEESIRGNPIDGVVLLMGCDKTTPSLMMGAASCDLPTIGLSGGPMLKGRYHDREIGSGTGVWQMSEDVRAGKMPEAEFFAAEASMSRSKGHCMTMGTASTMACMVEAVGMALPGNAAIPAVDARRYTLAQLTGRRIVQMVHEDMRMSQILQAHQFRECHPRARRHRRLDQRGDPPDRAWPDASACPSRSTISTSSARNVSNIVDIQPSGTHLMEDFYYAGGLPAVMKTLAESGCSTGRRRPSTGAASARTSPTPRTGTPR